MVVLALFLVSLLWGSTFIFNKILLEYFPVSFLVVFRFLIAGLIFGAIFHKYIRLNKRVLRNGFIIGVFNGIGLIIQVIGLKYTTASNSAFITTTYLIFTPIIEYFLWKQKINKHTALGIVTAILGMYLLSFSDLFSFSINKGDFITLFCGLVYAFQIFFIGHYTREENTYGLVFVQFLMSALMGVFYFFYEISFGGVNFTLEALNNPTVLTNLLVLSTVATFVPFSLQFYVQKKISPTVAGVGYSMEPVFAMIIAMIVLNERINNQNLIGIVLIFIGVLIVSLKGNKN